jgi:hypothetical protein
LQKYKIFQIFNSWYPRNCCLNLHELHREIMVKTICQIWDKMFLNEWILIKLPEMMRFQIPEEQCRRRRTTKNTLKIFFFFLGKKKNVFICLKRRWGKDTWNLILFVYGCYWNLQAFALSFSRYTDFFFLYFIIFLFQVLKN